MRFRPDIAIRRFRERKLGQWALAYVAASWAWLEVLDLLVEHFARSSTDELI